jgi:putative membrane protein
MNSWRLSTAATVLAAAGLMMCMGVTAQMPGGGAGQMPQGEQSPSVGQPNGPGNPGDNLPGAQGSSMPSFADQAFVRKTLEDNQAQIQMGQLAAQKSSSDDVKQFGEKMTQIHEQLSDQMKPVARKLGVSEPKEPSKKEKQEIEEMQSLSGADFDAAFIKAMMREQQSDLKDFKSEAQSAQDPAVQQLAKLDAPVLSQHLQILEQLALAHNVTMESMK